MIKDPLTKKEHRIFLKNVIEQYETDYRSLLSSGMLDDDDDTVSPHSHIIARIAIQVAVSRFSLHHTKYKKLESMFV